MGDGGEDLGAVANEATLQRNERFDAAAPGPTDHVKRVSAADRVGASIADHVSDPFGPVSADMGDPGASPLPRCLQRIEEGVHGRAFATGTGPHQPAAVVVDHDGHYVESDLS